MGVTVERPVPALPVSAQHVATALLLSVTVSAGQCTGAEPRTRKQGLPRADWPEWAAAENQELAALTGRIGSRQQLAGDVSWGCSGGAQRSYGDHLHPIQLRFHGTSLF